MDPCEIDRAGLALFVGQSPARPQQTGDSNIRIARERRECDALQLSLRRFRRFSWLPREFFTAENRGGVICLNDTQLPRHMLACAPLSGSVAEGLV